MFLSHIRFEQGDVADNETLFITLAACMLTTIFVAIPTIPQDLKYHNFADQRTLPLCGCGAGIPNSADVLSNIPFFVVGLLGLDILYDLEIFPTGDFLPGLPKIKTQSEHEAWSVFFIGILLVSFGSGYYHWYVSLSLSLSCFPITHRDVQVSNERDSYLGSITDDNWIHVDFCDSMY